MEEIVVGLAKSLPCLMLLGTGWHHLQEVVAKAMGELSTCDYMQQVEEVLVGVKLQGQGLSVEEKEEIDLESIIGDGH